MYATLTSSGPRRYHDDEVEEAGSAAVCCLISSTNLRICRILGWASPASHASMYFWYLTLYSGGSTYTRRSVVHSSSRRVTWSLGSAAAWKTSCHRLRNATTPSLRR